MEMGRLDEAKETIEQALAAARACEDTSTVAHCLNVQAAVVGRSDVRTARELYAQALAASRALGDESGAAVVLSNLAELEFADGRPEQALSATSELLDIDLRGKNAAYIATDYVNSAAYSIALGDLTGARGSACEALRLARQTRNEALIAVALQHLAVLVGLGGEARRGAQLLGYVDAQYTALEIQRGPTEQWGYDKLMAALRETLSADEIAQLSAEGASWSEDRAVEEVLKV